MTRIFPVYGMYSSQYMKVKLIKLNDKRWIGESIKTICKSMEVCAELTKTICTFGPVIGTYRYNWYTYLSQVSLKWNEREWLIANTQWGTDNPRLCPKIKPIRTGFNCNQHWYDEYEKSRECTKSTLKPSCCLPVPNISLPNSIHEITPTRSYPTPNCGSDTTYACSSSCRPPRCLHRGSDSLCRMCSRRTQLSWSIFPPQGDKERNGCSSFRSLHTCVLWCKRCYHMNRLNR